MNWKAWFYHLVSMAISGAANSITACFIDPTTFNLTSGAGWGHVGELALVGAVVPVLSIVKTGLPEAPVTNGAPPSSSK